jgi:hypothetical protein
MEEQTGLERDGVRGIAINLRLEYPISNPTSLRSYERAGTECPITK